MGQHTPLYPEGEKEIHNRKVMYFLQAACVQPRKLFSVSITIKCQFSLKYFLNRWKYNILLTEI